MQPSSNMHVTSGNMHPSLTSHVHLHAGYPSVISMESSFSIFGMQEIQYLSLNTHTNVQGFLDKASLNNNVL